MLSDDPLYTSDEDDNCILELYADELLTDTEDKHDPFNIVVTREYESATPNNQCKLPTSNKSLLDQKS